MLRASIAGSDRFSVVFTFRINTKTCKVGAIVGNSTGMIASNKLCEIIKVDRLLAHMAVNRDMPGLSKMRGRYSVRF